jgi:tRNA-dihydrouridine synthase
VAERLQDIGVAALSIHARTRSNVQRTFWLVTHCPSKKQPKITMPIFGNGDIDSPEKALKYKMNMVSTVSWLVVPSGIRGF